MARNRNNKTLDRILREIYTELYAKSTPPASFSELMKNAKWVDGDDNIHDDVTDDEAKSLGYKKKIPYEDYFISQAKFDAIVKNFYDKYKLNERDRKILNFNVYLGCGPTFSKPDDTKKEKEDE